MEGNVDNTVDYPTRKGMIEALMAARADGVKVEVVGNGRTLRYPAGYGATDAPQTVAETPPVPQAPPAPSEPAETPTGPSDEVPPVDEPPAEPSDEAPVVEDVIGDVEPPVEPSAKRTRKRGGNQEE